jgi:hypothetical protein
MTSPFSALTWEMWRRSRRAGSFALGLLILCAVVAFLVPDKNWARENLYGVFILLMIWSFILLFAVFHYAEHNPRTSWHGFPYRLFVLPVPTLLLIALPMVLGFLVTQIFYFAWARLVFGTLGSPLPSWLSIILGIGIVCYQSLIWCLAGFRITRLLALALAGLIFMTLALIPTFAEAFPQDFQKVNHSVGMVLAGVAAAAFFGAWFAVERQRRGGGRGRGWFWARLRAALDILPRRRRKFSSASAAQFWFEWRRAGWLLPAATGFTLLAVFVPVSCFTRNEDHATLWILAWALGLPIIFGVVVGKGLGKPEFWASDHGVPSFLAIRPLASGQVVVTKMKVAACSVLITWVVVALYFCFWLPLWAETSELRELWEAALAARGPVAAGLILSLGLLSAIVMTWRGMVGGMWIGLSGNLKFFFISAALGMIALGFGIWGGVYLLRHFQVSHLERFVSWFGLILSLAVILKVWLGAFVWRRITPGRRLRYALIWTALTGAMVLLALLLCPNVFWLKHLVILAALLPIPLARLGWAPQALARNRHR